MHEFVGRQSALPLGGSYLSGREMIYLLILWLVQEIKKSRRARAGGRFSCLPQHSSIKTPGERSSPRQAEKSSSSHDSTAEDLSLGIPMDCLSIHLLGVSGTLVLAEIPHFSLCRPTYISQDTSENGQSFQWLLSPVSSKRVDFQRNAQARLG